MKFLGFAALAIAAAQTFSAPSYAEKPLNFGFSGSLEAYFEIGKDDYWDDYNPFRGWGGAGRLNYWINPMVSTQVDVSLETFRTKNDLHKDEYDIGSQNIAVHLNYREAGSFLIGGLFQLTMTEDGGNDGSLGGYVLGVEGQYTWDRLTLYAQTGFAHSLFGVNLDDPTYRYSMYFGNLEARYFVLDNLQVTGGIGFLTGEYFTDDGYDATGVTWSGGVEYRIDDTPISFFARGQGIAVTDRDVLSYENTISGQFGVKIMFGPDTLRGQNDFGVTLHEFNPLQLNWMRYD